MRWWGLLSRPYRAYRIGGVNPGLRSLGLAPPRAITSRAYRGCYVIRSKWLIVSWLLQINGVSGFCVRTARFFASF
jgi:hypothetical protein